MKALLELTLMRVILLLRQPEIVFWAFVFPVMLSVVLGLAFQEGGDWKSRVAVVDSPHASEMLDALEGVDGVEVVSAADDEEASRLLRSGTVDVVLVSEGGITLRFDELRPEAAVAKLRVENALQVVAGREDPIAIDSEATVTTGSRYIDWFVPGLLALSIMSTSVWAVGFSFVDARQKKLIKRFLVTPMSRASFLLSHVLARLALLVFEVSVLLVFAHWALDVPVAGSAIDVFLACAVGALVFAGVGVLLGSRSRTLEGAAGLINLTMMPMGLASGVFFSYERFSEGLQPLIRALPLAPFIDTVRGVMLDGRPLGDFAGAIALQLVWGVVTFLAGLALFRWK